MKGLKRGRGDANGGDEDADMVDADDVLDVGKKPRVAE